MNKTKLGITANAYAALIFAAGLLGIIPVVLLAGAALIMEENEWLKRMSVKAIAFIVVLNVFSVLLLLLPDFFDIIRDILYIVDVDHDIIEVFDAIISIFYDVFNGGWVMFGNIMLIVYAFLAYRGKYAKVFFIEGLVNRNM